MQKYVGRIEKILEQETDARIKRILAPVVRGLLAQEKRLARIEQQLDELIAHRRKTGTAYKKTEKPSEPFRRDEIELLCERLKDKYALSQSKIAELVGSTYVTISAWRNGDNIPRANNVRTIRRFVQMNDEELDQVIAAKFPGKMIAAQAKAPAETAKPEPVKRKEPKTKVSTLPAKPVKGSESPK